MINLNYPAIRALIKALCRSQRYEAQLLGAQADAQFDGGEWSSAYHADALDAIEIVIASRVGARFGMSGAELLEQAHLAEWEQQGQMLEAQRRANRAACAEAARTAPDALDRFSLST